ncbi:MULTISPECIES: hypothetical protein [unclassified Rhizobacter]|uniref:hypothetical protein n=1 Tax=unclassified Rhizobacter TaxID=2640088 RepID=UPI0006FA4B91|nr:MULTISPECIES: hypothetical protein [unclassified Rhizobacter]KQU81117.1 hypothetical protein ASC88_16485 [Rhizobacter sp. Root29]KQW04661.1 hypothetical protein ASC98_06175 [Rhizobacter sp. Root1238]KRB06500.1 hypothetical protein ASE08_12715 [Rhizobacter sp. Root16D2]
MKATFGFVSLLIALAIIGIVINKQLKAVGKVPVVAADGSVSQGGGAASGTAREQSQQLQQKVRNDVAKALEQGAQGAARQDDSAK